MAWSITRIPRTRAGSTTCGTCTNGWIARLSDATSRACGGSGMTSMRRPEAALLLLAAAGTVVWCGPMADMPGMPMPGGWTMTMAWMHIPGQTWWAAGATFIGMWSLMMVAMMLPVLAPVLRRVEGPVAPVAAGYFAVWTLLGV